MWPRGRGTLDVWMASFDCAFRAFNSKGQITMRQITQTGRHSILFTTSPNKGTYKGTELKSTRGRSVRLRKEPVNYTDL